MAYRYFVRCSACPAHIVLPGQNPGEKSPYQPYWPTGEIELKLLCQDCGFVFGHSHETIRREWVETPDPNPRPSVFWKATLECDHENCGQRFSLHTRTGADVPEAKVGSQMLLYEKSALTCPRGHNVSDARPVGLGGIE
jgi:hypothetical protein